MPLNERQQRFVEAYLLEPNATQAAIAAGYSRKTAYSQGQRLAKHAEVASALQQTRAEVAAKLTVTAQMIAARAWEIASQNRGDRTAALALLAKMHPEFNVKHEVEHSGEVTTVVRATPGIVETSFVDR